MEVEKNSETTFSERLRSRRTSLGKTQQSLADEVGLSKSAISHFELGLSEPSISSLIKLSTVLSCTLNYLILGTEKDHTTEFQNICMLMNKMSQTQRQLAERIVQSVSEYSETQDNRIDN